jgi:hypothetical protein
MGLNRKKVFKGIYVVVFTLEYISTVHLLKVAKQISYTNFLPMIILTFFCTIILIQTVKETYDQGIFVVQNPRFWTHLLLLSLVSYIYLTD